MFVTLVEPYRPSRVSLSVAAVGSRYADALTVVVVALGLRPP